MRRNNTRKTIVDSETEPLKRKEKRKRKCDDVKILKDNSKKDQRFTVNQLARLISQTINVVADSMKYPILQQVRLSLNLKDVCWRANLRTYSQILLDLAFLFMVLSQSKLGIIVIRFLYYHKQKTTRRSAVPLKRFEKVIFTYIQQSVSVFLNMI